MALLIHPNLAESTISQINSFLMSPSQTRLEDESFIEYHPVSVLTSTGLFEFTATSVENFNYIDLENSLLYVRATVTGAIGVDLVEDGEIAPECNFLNTSWSMSV